MAFIIHIKDLRGYGCYYGGKTYQFNYEIYPVEATRDNAKRYKSRKIAERVAKNLEEKIAYSSHCVVKETD